MCLSQPNRETITAMQEAERIAYDPSVKGYTDLDELFEALKKNQTHGETDSPVQA